METSLNFAHSSIELLKKELATQDSVIKELKRDVKLPTKQAKEEKQRAINLKSHSRRNNLNFFNIPEQKDESEKFQKKPTKVYGGGTQTKQRRRRRYIFERVHHIGKSSSTDKPRPLIAKFMYHKDKEFVISHAKNLLGTDFPVARDFPKEIVDKQKLLVPILKEAKKNGHDSKLVYDKLYINGQLHRP